MVAIGILVFMYMPVQREPYTRDMATGTAATTTQEATPDTSWQTYTDTDYQFAIAYPKNWKIAKDNFAGSPRITLYDPTQTGGATPPFTHHSDAVHVSIFPRGLPTEGISGETAPTSVQIGEILNQGTDFILKDKTPWATMLTFQNAPASWSGGFVWANAIVQNLDITCLRGEQFVPYEQCDVLTGDVYMRDGSVEPSIRATEVHMLESLHFIR